MTTDSPALIEVKNLDKNFTDVQALNDVSFSINEGQVIGFVGANGAGKTTLMRIMSLLDHPDRGEILYRGKNAWENASSIQPKIGWMPDAFGVYKKTTVAEYIDFFARAYGFKGQDLKARSDEVMEFTELDKLSDREITTLSKGMSQRLCLGRTLISDPEFLILDEPAAGLDPKARLHFKHLIRAMAEEGKTMLISSHILSELEDMCDDLLFIDKGKIVHQGKTQGVIDSLDSGLLLEVRALGDMEKLQTWLLEQEGIEVFEAIKDGFCVKMENTEKKDLPILLKKAVEADLSVYSFVERKKRIEDAFVEMVSGLESGEGND